MCQALIPIKNKHYKKIAARIRRELKEKGRVTLYKFVKKDRGVLRSIHKRYIWKRGLNKSSRQSIHITKYERTCGRLEHGFHLLPIEFVYHYYTTQLPCVGSPFHVIAVTCYPEDFVRTGYTAYANTTPDRPNLCTFFNGIIMESVFTNCKVNSLKPQNPRSKYFESRSLPT